MMWLGCSATRAKIALGCARRILNDDSFFSAPQLKRDALGGATCLGHRMFRGHAFETPSRLHRACWEPPRFLPARGIPSPRHWKLAAHRG